MSSERALHALGLSLGSYAVLAISLVVVSELLCLVVAGLLLWRKVDNWISYLIAVMLVMLGISIPTSDASILRPVLGPIFTVPVANIANYLGAVSLPLIFSLFPNGRFVPRWTAWLVSALIVIGLFATFAPPSLSYLSPVSIFIWVASIICLTIAQIYRYRFVSTTVERQQTKWVIYGFSLSMLINLVFYFPGQISPALNQPDAPYEIFRQLVGLFGLTLPLALAFGIAILRYRLYDIDVIINRTLVYGVLTAILTLVYFGSVFALQWLIGLFAGHFIVDANSPLLLIVSTVGIAALFQPLQRRIQAVIDRRFYRHKYDADRTLATFSASLQNHMELDQLRQQLVVVVEETMQPVHVSLWLRPTTGRKKTFEEQD